MHIRLTVFLLILLAGLPAQNLLMPLPHNFNTSVSKQNITWDWTGDLTYEYRPDNGVGIRLMEQFHSNLIAPDRNIHQWRDENRIGGFVYHRNKNLFNGLYFDSWFLRDRQTSNVTQFGNHALGIKSSYYISEVLALEPYVGYQKSENRNIIDYGWDTGINARVTNYPMGNYYLDGRIQSDFDFYPARQNASNVFDVQIKTIFSPRASDSLAINYSLNDQEYFAQNGTDLIHLQIESRSLNNFLYYALAPNARFELITQLSARNIDDDSPVVSGIDDVPNQRDVMRIENRLNYRADYNRFNFLVGVHTFQETQDNQKVSTDSKALQTSLLANISYRPALSDQIDLKLSFVKFQYETPDSITNHDDRDEMRLIGQLNYMHRFSPLLLLNLEFYGNFFHKMYIFKEQSANNNWNRIYRLSAEVAYRYKNLSNLLQTYVLANYTVYDFDAFFEETRSFVFRKYVVSDSLRIPLIKDYMIGFYGRLELEDRGTFFESDFTQRVLESAENIYYDFYLQKRNVLRLTMDVGLSVYRRRGWRHYPEKYQDRDIHKYSPYIRVVYPLNRNINFRGYLALTQLDDSGREKNRYATGNLSLAYYF